jgi:hypothetical protein
MGEKVCTYSFLKELLSRTSTVPVNTDSRNECVCVDMPNSSKDFIINSERFLKLHPDRFRILARSLDLYLEINNGETCMHAYEKACKDEQVLDS